jgi:hypothetical protein
VLFDQGGQRILPSPTAPTARHRPFVSDIQQRQASAERFMKGAAWRFRGFTRVILARRWSGMDSPLFAVIAVSLFALR